MTFGPLLMAAVGGIAGMLALRDLLVGSPLVAEWVRQTLEPLRRARLEGYLPDSRERFRLTASVGAAAVAAGWWLGGIGLALPLAAGGPATAGWLVSRGRRRYRREIERALPDVALAIADCLAAGHSPRGALAAATDSLEGTVLSEFRRLRFQLEAGRPTSAAVRALAERFGSGRVDAFAAALISQQRAGGDLAGLLRRFADGAAERDRIAEDARAATAQARFTGYLVVAMPAGGALFVELLQPGFLLSLAGSAVAMLLIGASALLQLGAFLAISRLARIGEPL